MRGTDALGGVDYFCDGIFGVLSENVNELGDAECEERVVGHDGRKARGEVQQGRL